MKTLSNLPYEQNKQKTKNALSFSRHEQLKAEFRKHQDLSISNRQKINATNYLTV